MRQVPMIIALALAASLAPAMAQVVSPLGGSTTNPQSPPPATATPAPSAPAPAAPASSSPAATSPAPAKPAKPAHARRSFAERFAAANTTHDGKLTLEQARAGHMRSIVRDFAQIDKTKRGYVTLDEVKVHQSEMRAAHRAARAAKPQ